MRRLFDVLRGVDAPIRSLIFIRASGLGPRIGAPAIAFTDTLGKPFSEALETVDDNTDRGRARRCAGRRPHAPPTDRPMPRLSEAPRIDPTSRVTDSRLGRHVEIRRDGVVSDTTLGDHPYGAGRNRIVHGEVGTFADIAGLVRLNPGDDPRWRASKHHSMYRAGDHFDDAEPEAEFFAWRAARRVTVGHDTWLGHARGGAAPASASATAPWSPRTCPPRSRSAACRRSRSRTATPRRRAEG